MSVFIFAILHPLLDKIHPIAGIVVCVVLTVLLWNIQRGQIGIGPISITFDRNTPELLALPFGIGETRLYASDYFPILPWIFIFFAGTFLGKYFASPKLPEFFYKRHVPPLHMIGRHSLLIYILHQLVIYGPAHADKLYNRKYILAKLTYQNNRSNIKYRHFKMTCILLL